MRSSEIAEIPSTELNELLNEFILSVRTKEGQDYELPKFPGMVASFKKHLKRKSCSVTIINDLISLFLTGCFSKGIRFEKIAVI